jgi:glutamine cyclotransferase
MRFIDPNDFQTRRAISVFDGSRAIDHLNELEYIKGEIFANIWLTDRVARIDPNSGRVTAWINLAGLLSPEEQSKVDTQGGVLNGIAYDGVGDRLFVTGKLWPKLFEIKLKPRRTGVSR